MPPWTRAWRARTELDDEPYQWPASSPRSSSPSRWSTSHSPGVSGHLLGGALAAILVGPFTGALCIAIVLIVQSLLFADGGVTALGTNITNMAVIGVAATAQQCCCTHREPSPRSVPTGVLGAVAFASALVGTVCAAMGFVLEYAVGGAASASLGMVASYMLHRRAIGIGEGVITAVTVMAVAQARPDLVYLLRRARVEVPA